MSWPAPQLLRSDSWFDSVWESFERDLLRQNFAPATVRNYGIGIKSFFVFARDNGVDDFHRVDRDLVERWQDHLRERVPPLRSASRGLYATALRRLIRFAAERDIVDPRLERAVVGVRTRRRESDERRPIEQEDLAKLMAYLGPRRARMSVIDYRDRALFYVLLATGLRVGEVLQQQRTGYMRGRVRQKGGEFVDFELPPFVVDVVSDYVRRRVDAEPWLWVRHGNNANVAGRLEDSGVREIWRRLSFRLGIPRFTTHQLRHTSATVLLELDVDGIAVAKHLHHADLRTVQRYAKVRRGTRERTLEVMERFVRAGSTTIAPAMLERRSPPGGRPRYRS